MAQTIIITKSKAGVTYSRPLDYVLTLLRDGEYVMTIDKRIQKRTLPQNALMWMWFSCISQETGQPIQNIHDTYCSMFLLHPIVTHHGTTLFVPGHTSKLNKQQMQEFMEKVQADAAEMGIILPLPEDAYYEDFINEYQNRIKV